MEFTFYKTQDPFHVETLLQRQYFHFGWFEEKESCSMRFAQKKVS